MRFYPALIIMLFCSNSYGQDTTNCIFITDTINGIEHVLFPEVEPEFKGGESELMSYLWKNFEYPKTAGCWAGMIYVSFYILSDGSVSNVEVRRTFDPDFSESAIKLIQNMPKWIPGRCGENPVNVHYTFPIIIN